MNNETVIPLKVKISKKDIYNICDYSDKMCGNAYKLVYKFLDDDYNKVLLYKEYKILITNVK